MLDKLDFTVTLALFNGNSSLDLNQHTYTIFIDDKQVATETFQNKSFGAISVSRFTIEHEFKEHQLKVKYTNTRGPGYIKVENVYVSGPSGSGVNCDNLLTRESVILPSGKTNSLIVKSNETYCLTYTSPFFYWVLSKFPI